MTSFSKPYVLFLKILLSEKKKRGEEFSTYVIWLGKNWNADKFWFLLSMILTL